MKVFFVFLIWFMRFVICQTAHVDRRLFCQMISKFDSVKDGGLSKMLAKRLCADDTNSLRNGHSSTDMNIKQFDWLGNKMEDKAQVINYLLTRDDHQFDNTKQWKMRVKRALQSNHATNLEESKTEEPGSESLTNREEGGRTHVSNGEESPSEHFGFNRALKTTSSQKSGQETVSSPLTVKQSSAPESVPPFKVKQTSVQEPASPVKATQKSSGEPVISSLEDKPKNTPELVTSLLKAKQTNDPESVPSMLEDRPESTTLTNSDNKHAHSTAHAYIKAAKEEGESSLQPKPQGQRVRHDNKQSKADNKSFTTMTLTFPMNADDTRKVLGTLAILLKNHGVAHRNKDTEVKHQAVGGVFSIKSRI